MVTQQPRTLAEIDKSIGVEQAVMEYERRAGDDTPATRECRERMNELLEERSCAMRARDLRAAESP